MSKEFCLSDKRLRYSHKPSYDERDLKEFIKLLNEGFKQEGKLKENKEGFGKYWEYVVDEINKRAGDKLT